MAAGLGFKTFTTGEVLTAADINGYLMQGVLVFASSAARAAAITSPQEGQYSYLKDTNSTEYYDGAAWIAAPIGDITGVTAGTGISGGGTSGTVTVTNSMATEITAKGDLIAGTGSATFDNLPVGTNGQVLTADSTVSPTGLKWATAASGALTKIQTSTFSAVANTSTTFDGVFTSTYRNYVIAFNNMFSSGSQQCLMQVRVSGTTRTSGYYGSYNVVPYNGSITTTGVNAGSAMQILNLQNSTGPAGLTLNARGGVSGTSSEPQFYGTGFDVVSLGPLWCGFERTTGEVVTGFILSVASGTVSGTVTVYGVEN